MLCFLSIAIVVDNTSTQVLRTDAEFAVKLILFYILYWSIGFHDEKYALHAVLKRHF